MSYEKVTITPIADWIRQEAGVFSRDLMEVIREAVTRLEKDGARYHDDFERIQYSSPDDTKVDSLIGELEEISHYTINRGFTIDDLYSDATAGEFDDLTNWRRFFFSPNMLLNSCELIDPEHRAEPADTNLQMDAANIIKEPPANVAWKRELIQMVKTLYTADTFPKDNRTVLINLRHILPPYDDSRAIQKILLPDGEIEWITEDGKEKFVNGSTVKNFITDLRKWMATQHI